jgi:CRISPR/Cas system-associated exonuclease Cas4 (RecB family)
MKKINASELGTYLYCERAWWYRQQGFETDNITELASGSELHEEHGRAVFFSGISRTIAFLTLLISLVIFVFYLVRAIL